MGGTSGHVSLGLAFLLIGLWHLFNTIKLHSLHPKSFLTPPWFSLSSTLPYSEPITIMLVTLIFISMELFSNRTYSLPHIEHSIIALSFFIYASFGLLLHKFGRGPARLGLVHLLQAAAFGQQLLILHLHSTDHIGVEGQYHWLLQIITSVTLITVLLAVGYPRSFLISFVRAFSVVFQGVWLIVMGFLLWTPHWMPKGCFLRVGSGRDAVVCRGDRALDRAKALVNVQFGLCLIVLTVLSMLLYLALIRLYPRANMEYDELTTDCREERKADGLCVSSRTSLPM